MIKQTQINHRKLFETEHSVKGQKGGRKNVAK